MITTSRSFLFCALSLAAPLVAVACSDTPSASAPPQATGETTTAAAETGMTAAPTATAEAAPTAEPTAAPTASATAAATADKPKPSGRPPVLLANAKSITDTFGFSPGARLELGDKSVATLRIPEGAFTQATNVTFELDSKCKTTGLVMGSVYKVTPTLPPATTPASVASNNGSPFVFIMPTNKKAGLNMAIGTFGKDAKGNDTMTFKIVAPKSTDDANGTATFELDTLPDGCLHLTTKNPS
ncbi:MAG: hypothetical protein U0441_06225 [Polyangiaceae bacterium]